MLDVAPGPTAPAVSGRPRYARCAGCSQTKLLDDRGFPYPHNRFRYHRRLHTQRCPGENLPALIAE